MPGNDNLEASFVKIVDILLVYTMLSYHTLVVIKPPLNN